MHRDKLLSVATLASAALVFGSCTAAADTLTWTGGGTDALMTTPDNWSGSGSLTDGSSTAVFATGGSVATAAGSVYLQGMTFNLSSNFAVNASGDEFIALGEGGIATENNGTYTVSAPVKVLGFQTWHIGGSKDFTVSGGVNSEPNAFVGVTKTGSNALKVSGGGNFCGDVYISEGTVQLNGEHAFGQRNLTLSDKIYLGTHCSLVLSGASVDKPVDIDCGTTWANDTSFSFWAGTSEMSGAVEFSDRNFNIYAYQNSDVTMKGGFSGTGYLYLRVHAGAKLTFADEPVSLSQPVSFLPGTDYKASGYDFAFFLNFNVAGNSIATLGHVNNRLRCTKVTTGVDWAFDSASMLWNIGDDALVDLKGTSQRIGRIDAPAPTGGRSAFTSSVLGGMLYLNQKADSTPEVDFTGELGVDFSGNYVTTITRAMTASGPLAVNSGTLAFSESGSWANASRVTVASGARITAVGAVFGPDTDLVLPNLSAIEYSGDSVVEDVRTLKVNGDFQSKGQYAVPGGVINVHYDGFKEVVDGTLELEPNEQLELGEDFICDPFTNIVLGAGSSLCILDSFDLDTDALYALEIGNGAAISLGERTIIAREASYYEEALAPGYHDDEMWLQSGAVYVRCGRIAGTDVSWTGAGETDAMADAGNWSATADLVRGTTLANLASGGTTAMVAGAPLLNGLKFNTSDGFTVNAADSGAKLRLASGGITTAGSGAYRLDVPVVSETEQTWAIDSDITLAKGLVSDSRAGEPLIRKTGSGSVYIDGESEGYKGKFSLDEGKLVVKEGSSFDTCKEISATANTVLVLAGSRLTCPVKIDAGGKWGNANGLSIWDGYGASEIAGHVTLTNGNVSAFVYVNNNGMGQLTFSGGLDINCYLYFRPYGGGSGNAGFSTVVITDHPALCPKYPVYMVPSNPNRDGIAWEMYLSVPGNVFAWIGHPSYRFKQGRLFTTVNGALDTDSTRLYIDGDFTWDLCGTSQRIGSIYSACTAGNKPRIINSRDAQATFSFKQEESEIFAGDFGGKLDVVMNGTATFTLPAAISATGAITVNGGTLAFAAGSSWSGASALKVTGSGKVTLTEDGQLGGKVALDLASASSIELANGVVQKVVSLKVGGTDYAVGSYSFGSGTVQVTGNIRKGSILIFH